MRELRAAGPGKAELGLVPAADRASPRTQQAAREDNGAGQEPEAAGSEDAAKVPPPARGDLGKGAEAATIAAPGVNARGGVLSGGRGSQART